MKVAVDLLLGGSPCQGFSFAGKHLNFNDPRSRLFFDYVKALKILKPKYFLLENVKMKKEYEKVITELLGVEPIEINSALVSAQNRRRLYWTNIQNITQPQDKGILLKDILEKEVDEKYCLKQEYVEKNIVYKNQEIKGLGQCEMIDDKKKASLFIKIAMLGNGGQGQKVYSPEGKSVSLTALGGGPGAKTGLYAIAQRGRHIVDGKRIDILGAKTAQRMETIFSEKSNTITSVQKDSLILDTKNYMIRKLTPIECERLQTLPDNYTAGISNTQRYKMLGNGWTVDVIAHILSFIPEKQLPVVVSLFDGISCGQVALERAGKTYKRYYASEIDKYAIQITKKNYPHTIQLGDITKIDWDDFIKTIDAETKADGSEKLEDVLDRIDWLGATKIIVAKPESKKDDQR